MILSKIYFQQMKFSENEMLQIPVTTEMETCLMQI